MNTKLFVLSVLLTALVPVATFAAVDPSLIMGVHGGGICKTDTQGGVGTSVPGGYFNNPNAPASATDPSIFPVGFFDAPDHYCYQETETWINLGVGLGGDTVNDYGWFYYNAPYNGSTAAPIFYSTAVAGKRNIKESDWFTTGTPVALSASLVANPTSILSGEQSLLTWSSTAAVSCAGTNFNTQGATSGSVIVAPAQTTTYTVTCTGQGGQTTTAPAVINHSEADAYNSTAVIADMQAHGGLNLPAIQGNTAFSPDQASMDHVCVLIDGAGSVASNIGARNYSSPGNNGVLSYTGGTWVRNGGVKTHMSTSFTCTRPGTTTTTSAPTASASASVSVSSPTAPADFSVQCSATPRQIVTGEQVTWSSSVTGGEGTYLYYWSGTDGLVGTGETVQKTYTTPGHKSGKLTVKYTPNGPYAGAAAPTTPANTAPTTPPAVSTPPQFILPPAGICPAIGWVTPVTGCTGSWQPLMTSGCQTGWQCVPAATTGTGGGAVINPVIQLSPSIVNLINSFEPSLSVTIPDIQTVNNSVLGASAQIAAGQCSPHGAVVGQSADLQDGVGFSYGIAGIEAECAAITPAGGCCSAVVVETLGAGGNTPVNTRYTYTAYDSGSIATKDSTAVTQPNGNQVSTNYFVMSFGSAGAGNGCTMQFSPATITAGQQTTISWNAPGASSLTVSNGIGALTPATSGSKIVTPTASGTYTATGTTGDTTVTNPPAVINHSEADAYNSTAVIADMQAHGGLNLPAIQGNTAFSPDQASMDHVCVLIDGAGSVASNIGARNYSSPGNNGVLSYTGGTWVRNGGVKTHMSTSFTCTRPGGTTIIPGSPISCQATLTVNGAPAPQSQTITADCTGTVCTNATCSCTTPDCGGVDVTPPPTDALTVSCVPSKSVAKIGDQITWTSVVTGGTGPYTYEWTGSDGLTGIAAIVKKVYDVPGTKTATLTVIDSATTTASVSTVCNGMQCTDLYCDGSGGSGTGSTGGGNGGGGGGVVITGSSCSSENFCKNSDVYHRDTQCTETFVKSCPLGCLNGECLTTAATPDLSITATPPLIRKGQTCTLQVSAKNVMSCSVTGAGLSRVLQAENGIVSVTTVVTPTLTQTTPYKLSCTDLAGATVSKNVDCKIAPTFQEF